jgi:Arc/MetJ-type ribon-helix-helix transcriptional regulator
MKSLNVELPDKLASELDRLVQSGWFHNEQELVRYALTEFVRHNLLDLTKQHQLEDIEWALRRRKERTEKEG